MAALAGASASILAAVLLLCAPHAAQASVLTPATLPLAVRNPYFSYWMHNAREPPWDHWPIFWAGQGAGLGIMASVPASNTVYPLFGKSHLDLDADGSDNYTKAFAHWVGVQYDACTTNMTFRIPPPSKQHEPLDLTISWLSPITPTSSMRQSIPASYISVEVKGTFDIDLYLEINGDFVTGQLENVIKWYHADIVFDDSGVELQAWHIQRQDEQIFTEFDDRPEWGKLYLTGPADARYESGEARRVRRRFARTGTLQNTYDQDFRGVKDREPVFALHKSFKLSSHGKKRGEESVLFTLTHVQDEIVQYASARGLTLMRPLWRSWFLTDYQLLMFHYLDYHNAAKLAANYSAQLEHDALKAGGREYADNVALTARQVLGATAFSGTPDNPLLFLKEISSNGNTQTVDVIFPSWPFFMYTNPRWGAYLLEPLLEHQLSGQYPNRYSMHDLGAHYPNMTGHDDGNDEYMPLEECGDMLIMASQLVNAIRYDKEEESQSIWAAMGNSEFIETHAEDSAFALRVQRGEDGIDGIDDRVGGGAKGDKQAYKWLSRSWKLWDQWTGYLVDEALYPRNQLSTDDFAGWLALHSNLALKGMVGIKAFSELAAFIGNDAEAKEHRNISETYIRKWQDLALARDKSRAKLSYNWFGSWTTLYSLYADASLCFHQDTQSSEVVSSQFTSEGQKPLKPPHSNKTSGNFIPHEVYVKQSRWYELSMQKYGLPLDSRHLYSKSDWQLQVAAVATPRVKKEIVNRMAKWINESEIFYPMSDLYETEEGTFAAGNMFRARPVVGSHFSLIALERACGGKGTQGLIWDEEDHLEVAPEPVSAPVLVREDL